MLGQRLRELRKWRQMTQVKLAQVSGVAQNYISELESETATNPSPEVIRRLVEALAVAPAELTAPATPRPVTRVPPDSPPATNAPSGHQYRGYRVREQQPDGQGYTAQLLVEVDGHPVPAHYWNSLDIEWGYEGAGPTALAYDLLVHAYNPTLARNHLRNFVQEVVARFPRQLAGPPGLHLEWTLTSQEIRDWLLQQGRPLRINVYWSPLEWIAEEQGPPRMLVQAQFLPDRRLMLELERAESDHNYMPVARWAVEQELRQAPPRWPVWQHVRDVDESEYFLFRA